MILQIIRPTSIESLKGLWVKIFLSRTDKVTKVTDGSVFNAIAYANSKLGQKALKDIALIQSRFFPDTAFGEALDQIAELMGISPRFGTLGSSTFQRIVADVGTTYLSATHTFKGSNGIIFDLESDITVGGDGFAYAKINSQSQGEDTNVEALTIDQVTPIPVGHTFTINEFKALGGRDIEDDDAFRQRIKDGINVLARPTLEYLEQVFLKFNTNVLRLYNYGTDGLGKIRIAVVSQDGSDFTPTELSDLIDAAKSWLALSELNPDGIGNVGITLSNIVWQSIDVSFRVELLQGFVPDTVRTNIQIRINKNLDYRFWVPGQRVEADDLLEIVKQTEGVRYVPDEFFFPDADFFSDFDKLPRIRGFLMLDLNGNIISNGSGTLNPVFYPEVADFSFQATVLANL